MPKRTIDLDALERVVGRAPRRFPMGDPRNLRRLMWWTDACHALGELLKRGVRPRSYLDAMQEREKYLRKGGSL